MALRAHAPRRRLLLTCAALAAVTAIGALAVALSRDEPDRLAAPPPVADASSPASSPAASPAPPPSADRPFVLQDVDISHTRGHERTWESARTDGEQAVLVSFVGAEAGQGPCQAEYQGEAVLQGDAFVVSVSTVPPPPGAGATDQGELICPAIGYSRTVRVQLPEPRAGRAVVDGRTGRLGPLFDGGALLHPPAVPEGHRVDEHGSFGAGALWVQSYRKDEDKAPLLEVVHSSDHGRPLDAHRTLVERVTVRGQEAVVAEQRDGERVVTREVTWRERGGIVSVVHWQTHVDSPELMPVDELVELAQSLR